MKQLNAVLLKLIEHKIGNFRIFGNSVSNFAPEALPIST